MNKILFSTLAVLSLASILRGQNPVAFDRVYSIFQAKCAASCHSAATKSGGLDLEGTGSSKPDMVLANLVNVTPTNAAASSKKQKRVYPGRIDRSYLFHKINSGFDNYYPALTGAEGAAMPRSGTPLTKVEKEIIRQWILFGANKTTKISEADIRAYYDTVGKALNAFDIPPAPPAANEGFQIKMGPYFLAPNGQVGREQEYYQKWELDMATDAEVNRIDHIISNYSHHLLIYNFNSPANAASIPAGLRLNANHSNVGLVSAVQERTDLKLPDRTAFRWERNRVLDLNSHYINYSANHIYKAEAYLNIYTQAVGTAKQEMRTTLIANPNIFINNNNQTVTFRQAYTQSSLNRVWLWTLMGHTHKYGTGYKIFRRNTDGSDGETLYDASCPNGVPGCASPYFDYQHIPMRYYQPLNQIDMRTGFTHQAWWKNNGTSPVWFGATSDDEMMVMIAMFTLDTTGLTGGRELKEIEDVQVFPNPMTERSTFKLPPSVSKANLTLYDMFGRLVHQQPNIINPYFDLERNGLPRGIYLYRLEDQNGRTKHGKIQME
jgi:hypothetical protein